MVQYVIAQTNLTYSLLELLLPRTVHVKVRLLTALTLLFLNNKAVEPRLAYHTTTIQREPPRKIGFDMVKSLG